MTDDLQQVVPFETDDGSMTLHDRERNVHYRSYHGAVTESRHVFLEGTALLERRGEWRVAELGFGAAVNFAQTVEAFRADDGVNRLVYRSVDWRPVTPGHLEFHNGEGGELARQAVAAVHAGQGPVVEVQSDDGAVSLALYAMPWEEVDWSGFSAHSFYQDPFSKRVNPEGWTAQSFVRAKAAMDGTGRLATYSAATSVKRAMFEAGLWVASAPGPGRKREITVASPSREVLEGDERLEVLGREKYVG